MAHRYSMLDAEVGSLVATGLWEVEPQALIRVFPDLGAGTEPRVPLYELHHPLTRDRLYTTSALERDVASALGYQPEGHMCYVFDEPHADSRPLLRLFNPVLSDHLYTISSFERQQLLTFHGYIDEGVACHVFANQPAHPDAINLHRLRHFDRRVPINLIAVGGDLWHPNDLTVLQQTFAKAQEWYKHVGILLDSPGIAILGSDWPGVKGYMNITQPGQAFWLTNDFAVNNDAIDMFMVPHFLVAYPDGTAAAGQSGVNGPCDKTWGCGWKGAVAESGTPIYIVHELGHYLGLDHNDPALGNGIMDKQPLPNALMFTQPQLVSMRKHCFVRPT